MSTRERAEARLLALPIGGGLLTAYWFVAMIWEPALDWANPISVLLIGLTGLLVLVLGSRFQVVPAQPMAEFDDTHTSPVDPTPSAPPPTPGRASREYNLDEEER